MVASREFAQFGGQVDYYERQVLTRQIISTNGGALEMEGSDMRSRC
jgi:hypothetical protein